MSEIKAFLNRKNKPNLGIVNKRSTKNSNRSLLLNSLSNENIRNIVVTVNFPTFSNVF